MNDYFLFKKSDYSIDILKIQRDLIGGMAGIGKGDLAEIQMPGRYFLYHSDSPSQIAQSKNDTHPARKNPSRGRPRSLARPEIHVKDVSRGDQAVAGVVHAVAGPRRG